MSSPTPLQCIVCPCELHPKFPLCSFCHTVTRQAPFYPNLPTDSNPTWKNCPRVPDDDCRPLIFSPGNECWFCGKVKLQQYCDFRHCGCDKPEEYELPCWSCEYAMDSSYVFCWSMDILELEPNVYPYREGEEVWGKVHMSVKWLA